MNLILLLLLVGFYLAVLMPQRRRAKARQAQLAALAPGDRVMLTNGVHGIVTGELGPTLIVQVAPGTPLHVARQGIMAKVGADEPGVPSLEALGVEFDESADHDDIVVDLDDTDIAELPAASTADAPNADAPSPAAPPSTPASSAGQQGTAA
jgi:preprotein translocase subunit YajC